MDSEEVRSSATRRASVIRGTTGVSPVVAVDGFAPQTKRGASYSRLWSMALCVSDVTMFVISSLIAISLVQHTHTLSAATFVLTRSSVIFILVWLLIFERLGLYRSSFALAPRDELYYTMAALGIGIIPQLVLYTLVPSMSTSRLIVLLSAAISVPLVSGMRYAFHRVGATTFLGSRHRIAIVGAKSDIDAVRNAMGIPHHLPVMAIECGDVLAELGSVGTHSVFNPKRIAWLNRAISWRCSRLILTEIVPPTVLPPLLATALRHNFSVAFAPPRFVSHAYSLSLRTEGNQVLFSPAPLPACRTMARLAKRACDLVLGSIALLLAAPLMAACTIAIVAESGTPILYRQRRVGRGGADFEMLKFRSMRTDAEATTGPVWVGAADARVTKVGKILRATSLDELPQLFNVLRGEMSLVGPRPERPVFVEQFRRHLPRYDERHLVRPGITGCAQVHMGRQLDGREVAEKLSYDLFYIENWSLFMDITLLFKTIIEVLFHRAR